MVLPTNYKAGDQLSHADWNQMAATVNNDASSIATTSATHTQVRTGVATAQTTANANQNAVLTLQQKVTTQAPAITAAQIAVTSIKNRLTVLETVAPPPAVPGKPTGLTSGTITNTSVVLSWTAPVGGAAPTSYQSRRAAAGTGNWVNGPAVTAPTVTTTVTGLTQGTAYDFYVAPINAAGTGIVSDTITRTTTVPFVASPAWTEMPPATSILMADGSTMTVVNGAVMRNTGSGAVAVGQSSSVILCVVSDTGRFYQESNDPALAGLPGGVGWFYMDLTLANPWVQSSDPRAVAPPSGTGFRNPNTIPFASTSAWNIGIGNNATWAAGGAAETTTLQSLILDVKTDNYGQPIWYGTSSDPLVTVSSSGQGTTSNAPWSHQFHVPAGALPAAGTDKTMNGYDATQPLLAWSLGFAECPDFGALHTGSVITSFIGGNLDLTKNGFVGSEYPNPSADGWAATANADFEGTDNWLGGVITQYDISQGVIRHALRCAISQAQLLAPNETPGSNVGVEWPETDVDYYHSSATYAGNLPIGTYGIPNNVDVTTLGLSAGGLMLAHCLQDYGMFWRDQGGNPPALSLYSVPELAGNARITEMNAAWNTIKSHVFRMTNQGANNVNGGGTRRVALLPPVGVGGSTPRIVAPLVGTVTTGSWAGRTITGGQVLPSGQRMHYTYLLPNGYSTSAIYPIFIWEHSNFEGNDWYTSANRTDYLPSVYGLDPWFNTTTFRRNYPCIVVLPYCDQTGDTSGGATQNFGGWTSPGNAGPNMQSVVACVQDVLATFSGDPSRVYLTGDSLGGIGTWAGMRRYNRLNGDLGRIYAAGVPFAGVYEVNGYGAGPNSADITALRNVPVFAVSGAGDTQSIPSHWNQPLWTAYAGNTSYPGSPGAQAGTSAYRYLEATGLGNPHDVSSYHTVPGIGAPLLDWLFAQVG